MIRALILGSVAAVALAGAATASDLIIPLTPQPIYESAGFDWSGAYAGVMAGGVFSDDPTDALLGGFVGYNMIVADPILLGVEFQGSWDWHEDYHSTKLLANARLGAIVTDSVLVYGIAGAGLYATTAADDGYAYQLGAGIELAVTDAITVRGEVTAVGKFDDTDDEFFDWTKATVGVAYHF